MHGIFINYRREDAAGFARSLFDRLKNHFGEQLVFMDVSNIEPGLDFVTTIETSLQSCDALLVLIGPAWEQLCIERQTEGQDFVRIEVATALERNVRVIPILVQGASMPAEEKLPEEIRPLVRRQALQLTNEGFDSDVAKLIAVLEKALGNKFKPAHNQHNSTAASTTSKISGKKGIMIGFALAFAVLIGIGVAVDTESKAPTAALTTIHNQPPTSNTTQRIPTSVPSQQQISEAQASLNTLGYQPGPTDGVMGANTIAAIRQFQRDEGLGVTGEVNEDLLDDAVDDLSTVPDAPATATLSGTWYDNFGYRTQIQHNGSQVTAISYDPYSGLQTSVAQGTFDGHQLNYQWTAQGAVGSGVGTLQNDQRHLDIIVTDAMTGMVQSNQLHKEHMPGQ